jgi:hypothetical protein
VTHPGDTKTHPTPPRSAEIRPAHLITPLSHLLRRFSSNPPPECLNPQIIPGKHPKRSRHFKLFRISINGRMRVNLLSRICGHGFYSDEEKNGTPGVKQCRSGTSSFSHSLLVSHQAPNLSVSTRFSYPRVPHFQDVCHPVSSPLLKRDHYLARESWYDVICHNCLSSEPDLSENLLVTLMASVRGEGIKDDDHPFIKKQ